MSENKAPAAACPRGPAQPWPRSDYLKVIVSLGRLEAGLASLELNANPSVLSTIMMP